MSVHNSLLCLKTKMTIPKLQLFYLFCWSFVKLTSYSCEHCIIIYVLVDLLRVMGVVISTLNNGKIMNLKRLQMGFDLRICIQMGFCFGFPKWNSRWIPLPLIPQSTLQIVGWFGLLYKFKIKWSFAIYPQCFSMFFSFVFF